MNSSLFLHTCRIYISELASVQTRHIHSIYSWSPHCSGHNVPRERHTYPREISAFDPLMYGMNGHDYLCKLAIPHVFLYTCLSNVHSLALQLRLDTYFLIRGSCKKFCHWVRITSVLRFIKHIFITNLQSIPPLLKHIFVTFLPSREKQINSLLLVSVGDTDK